MIGAIEIVTVVQAYLANVYVGLLSLFPLQVTAGVFGVHTDDFILKLVICLFKQWVRYMCVSMLVRRKCSVC